MKRLERFARSIEERGVAYLKTENLMPTEDESKKGACGAVEIELDVSGLSHARHMAWRAILQGHAALVERVGREVSAAGGVSLDSYDVMLALSNAPQGRLKMGELACHVVLSRSGLTRLVDRMEATGWVARELAAGDRRSFEAFLTPAGEAAFKATWPLYARAIALALAPLSDGEAQQMADWLDRARASEDSVTDGCESRQ